MCVHFFQLFFQADHLLSSSVVGVVVVFFVFFFYAKLLRFTIHCIFNLVGSTTRRTTAKDKGKEIATRAPKKQTNSKGPKHINKDFISFIHFFFFYSFFLLSTTHTHKHTEILMGRYFLFYFLYFLYSHSSLSANKWLNV